MSSTHDEAALEASRAPFMSHLVELRRRLVISIAAVLVGCALTWTWVEEIFQFLLEPLRKAATNPALTQMHHRSLTESAFVLMKTALLAGVILSVPVVLYQIWQFVAPGLYAKERNILIPFVIVGTLFFGGGVAFGYYMVLPYSYSFLLSFGTEVSSPQLMMEEYLDLTSKFLLAFGIVFEMPVVTTLLARIGLINHKLMMRFWRHAVVVSAVVGAVLTPGTDPLSMVLLMGPMIVLYFVSVGCAWAFGRPNALLQPSEDPQEA